MKTKATKSNLEKQAGEKSTADLTCRVWQHLWNVNRGSVDREGKFFIWSVPCDRCETLKTVKIERRTGRRSGALYTYPPEYGLHGLGALSTDERGLLRLILLRRFGKA